MVQRNQENAGKVEDKGKGEAGQERAGGGSEREGRTGKGQREGRKRKDSDVPSPLTYRLLFYQHLPAHLLSVRTNIIRHHPVCNTVHVSVIYPMV